jgi:F-type H+-transporting ATPase subunit alpha
VISITDGQIFLESELFHEGQRPAVNVGLSVSRVGGSAQIPAMKQMAGGLRISLAQYRELASFAQFGADLDQATQASLDRGERMTIALRQDQYEPLDAELQVLIIYAFIEGFADDVAPEKIPEFEDALIKHFKSAHPDLIAVLTKGKITPKTKERLNEALKLFKGSSE